jgi:hypothetical protein
MPVASGERAILAKAQLLDRRRSPQPAPSALARRCRDITTRRVESNCREEANEGKRGRKLAQIGSIARSQTKASDQGVRAAVLFAPNARTMRGGPLVMVVIDIYPLFANLCSSDALLFFPSGRGSTRSLFAVGSAETRVRASSVPMRGFRGRF